MFLSKIQYSESCVCVIWIRLKREWKRDEKRSFVNSAWAGSQKMIISKGMLRMSQRICERLIYKNKHFVCALALCVVSLLFLILHCFSVTRMHANYKQSPSFEEQKCFICCCRRHILIWDARLLCTACESSIISILRISSFWWFILLLMWRRNFRH